MSKPKIRLVPATSGVCLQASYNLKGGRIAMLVNGRYVEASGFEEVDKDGKVTKYKPDFIAFSNAVPYIDLTDRNSDAYKFWSNHPFVVLAHDAGANKNLIGTPVAYIYDDELIAIKKYEDFKKMLSVLNAVNALDDDDLIDLCYYMGIEVGSEKRREVLLGKYFCPDGLFVTKDSIDKISNYLHAVETGNAVRERAVVLFNKAYEAGLFTQDKNNYLYYDGRAIGEKDDVIMKIMTSEEFKDKISAALGGAVEAEQVKKGRGKKKKTYSDDTESDVVAGDGAELII